ncbi:endogenous retrovirus group V member 1 Env polyprotein-like [Patagioenas fasciata]|uniref:endogenous retrovirus group V member 1 Env polyprotein-like n=1 Tax=Patagioenas fasciata TaxID=372321 RepID=UPI003A9A16DB
MELASLQQSVWKLSKRQINNPLVDRPWGFHSFVWWFIPMLGLSELEKAIVSISVTLEEIENSTADALQWIQQEVGSLSKVVMQNRMGLDILLAKEGRLCMAINQTCCTYINKERQVETELQRIWEMVKLLHQVSKDDTSFGFTNLREKLTSRLLDLGWFKQLFVLVIILIVLSLLICILLRCLLCCTTGTMDSYIQWKKHQLQQEVESGKYFMKRIESKSIL